MDFTLQLNVEEDSCIAGKTCGRGRSSMVHVLTQQSSSDDPVVVRLLAGWGQPERAENERQEAINLSVIQMLRERVSYWVRVDIPRAMKIAGEMRQAAGLMESPDCEAVADQAYAQALHVSGRYGEAIQFFQRAEEVYVRQGNEVEAAQIARAKVGALMCLGQYDLALQAAAKAREVFLRYNRPILLARLESNIGSIYHRLDQYQEALTCYERAGEIFQTYQDEKGLAHVRFNAANQYTCLNEFERALSLYQQAQEAFENLEMPLLVNQTEYSIAWLYFQRGRFHESLRLFAKVRARSRELKDWTMEALCDLDLAEVYLQLNTYEDAIESAESAAEKFEALEMSYERAKARMYRGIAHLQLNDFATAEDDLQNARRGFRDEGNEVFAALTNLYLGNVARHRGHWRQAAELCEEAQRIFHGQGLSVKAAYAQLQLARLRLGLGQVQEAQRLCQSALTAIGDIEAAWLKYQCYHLLGNTKDQSGERAEAYCCYRRAVTQLEDLRRHIRVDEFRWTFLRDKLNVYEDLVELCLREGTEEKNEEALSYVEAAKSRALVDLLATSDRLESRVLGPPARAVCQEWRQLREQLDWYYNRISSHELSVPHDHDQVGQLRHEVRQRERQLSKLVRRVWCEDAEYASLHTVSRLDIGQLRQCLGADEVLIEYYIVAGRVKIFVVRPDGLSVFSDVSKMERITLLLRTLRFYLDKFTLSRSYVKTHHRSIEALTDECLRELHRALVEPIAPLLEGKKVVIVPHNILHYVPFHTLYDGCEYLIDRHEISYCPSASVFKLCSEKAPTPRAGGQMLIMGDTDEAMPFIRKEVAAVTSLWPEADVLLGNEASLDYLTRHAAEYRFLHLASHGVFRRDNPLFSALKLGDSWLNFYDIFNLNLRADLVTLSACETGINEVFPGDELFGLMRGFLYAGAPSLVVSLWMVNDRAAAELMRWFYSGLWDGLTKRAALRRAQLKVKQEYRHPYYWAPFVLMGAPL